MPKLPETPPEIAAELGKHVDWLRDLGVRAVAKAAPQASVASASLAPSVPSATLQEREWEAAPPSAGQALGGSPGCAGAPLRAAAADPVSALRTIREDLGDCRRCRLCEGRKNIVFGTGAPGTELVFVGEGPGADEDAQGEPFVGRAGQLLTKMIEAMGFARGEVYICNVVKCRPPDNRNPLPDEIAACRPFLDAQLDAIRPRAIVALGRVAAQVLLGNDRPISSVRGRWHEVRGIPLMPTFHPAYLLRSPGEKPKAWDDLKKVLEKLGRTAPQRGVA